MGEEGEDGDSRDGGVEAKGEVGAEEDEEGGGAEELREVEEGVLVPGVEAVGCEVGGGEVVEEVVEGGDCWVGEEGGPG